MTDQKTVERFHVNNKVALNVYSKYTPKYPEVVTRALCEIFVAYNEAFQPLVEANRENPGDYQETVVDAVYTNFAVQIDMVGLEDDVLLKLVDKPLAEVVAFLRSNIFEIENSVAWYGVLEKISPEVFKPRWRAVLDDVRCRTGKPIALLGVTEGKTAEMLHSEFGLDPGDTLTPEMVKAATGYDIFLGPKEFLQLLEDNDGVCPYVLYVRASEPVGKLRKPNKTSVEHPLLADASIREVIKANSITLNIDAPEMEPRKRINDTKGYLAPMGMGFEIASFSDLLSDEMSHLMQKGRGFADCTGPCFSSAFAQFLESCGIAQEDIENGSVPLRAKPLKGTYGCYGHHRGRLDANASFRSQLKRDMKKRGHYVIQPEMDIPVLRDAEGTATHAFIDRNFIGIVDGAPVFLGGFRNCLPLDSQEVQKGRLHGNGDAVWAPIVVE